MGKRIYVFLCHLVVLNTIRKRWVWFQLQVNNGDRTMRHSNSMQYLKNNKPSLVVYAQKSVILENCFGAPSFVVMETST